MFWATNLLESEFCFDDLYYQFNENYSESFTNSSAFQAWRAGFREGVKMCLNRGNVPTVDEFKIMAASRNLNNLTIWHNVGRDVDNGIWAILGSRMGTYMTMITPTWDYRQVQDFDALKDIFKTIESSQPRLVANQIADELSVQLDLPMIHMDVEQSAFFKQHYRSNWHNRGIMVREIDVIREQEGW